MTLSWGGRRNTGSVALRTDPSSQWQSPKIPSDELLTAAAQPGPDRNQQNRRLAALIIGGFLITYGAALWLSVVLAPAAVPPRLQTLHNAAWQVHETVADGPFTPVALAQVGANVGEAIPATLDVGEWTIDPFTSATCFVVAERAGSGVSATYRLEQLDGGLRLTHLPQQRTCVPTETRIPR